MKVGVFGASGGIGRLVVKHALQKGYAVNAYVRDPAKLQTEHDSLSIITGGLRDTAAIEQTISGCDAVVCALGVPLKFAYDSMDSLESHRNIITAMDKLGVSRLVDWATPSVRFSGDKPSFVTVVPGILAGIAFPKARSEIVAICEAIKESDLQWTIVRFMVPKGLATHRQS